MTKLIENGKIRCRKQGRRLLSTFQTSNFALSVALTWTSGKQTVEVSSVNRLSGLSLSNFFHLGSIFYFFLENLFFSSIYFFLFVLLNFLFTVSLLFFQFEILFYFLSLIFFYVIFIIIFIILFFKFIYFS